MNLYPPAIPNAVAPVSHADRMHLRIKRSQRTTGVVSSKAVFILDARVDLTAADRNLISKYKLGDSVVYDSKERVARSEAAYGNFDNASQTWSAGRSLLHNARGIANAAMAALALRVTVDKLVSGVHIECKDLNELIGAEAAIVEACEKLRLYMDTAVSFDGREAVLEF
ncbi:MAG: hypothetical protein ACKVP4_08550 [Hyphomicrobium sp.]